MEGQQFLTEYRSINNKLKKRFLRRPNVSEASEQFRQLGRRLEEEEPQYAAYCHLATARCEQTVGNCPGEIEAAVAAGRNFLRAELREARMLQPSLELEMAGAVAGFRAAAQLHSEANRPLLAAGLYTELADAFWSLDRPLDALPHYQAALALSEGHTSEQLGLQLKLASCHIATPDHHNALLVLSEAAVLAAEDGDPLLLHTDTRAGVETTRLLLLLITEPSPHNTAPELLALLARYQAEDGQPLQELGPQLAILLQSLALAVQQRDREALLYLEDELVERLTEEQAGLLRTLVSQTTKRL